MSILGRFGPRERLPRPAGEQKEYKEVEKIVHKEVIKEVTVGVSEEELSKVRGRVVEARRHRADAVTETCALATQVHAEAERKKEEIRERVLTRRRRT